MKRISFVSVASIVVVLMIAQLSLAVTVSAEPTSFNDPNFQSTWERTDKPVEILIGGRGYDWGPNTLPGSPSTEPYANSPGGNRTVQYFDKSRMEVNDPNGDRSNLFFVTNGLLVREMVSGNLQLGDTQFESRTPATEAVSGDPSTSNADSPTYATFKKIASLNNDNPSTDQTGQPVVQAIDKAGNVTTITSPDPSVMNVFFDPNLKHNIPNKINDFLNMKGPIFVNGQIVPDQQVIDPVFLAGLPITEAYWVKSKVGGVEKDVLAQLFERRVITYTPSNPAQFQVEMGNVGQHYLRWRYGGGPKGEERIAFHSNMAGGTPQIYSVKTDGTDLKQLTTAGANFAPRWSPDNQKIAFSSDRDGNDELYIMNADGSNQTRLTFTPLGSEGTVDWSPDGSTLFFDRETGMKSDVFSMAAGGGGEKQLTTTGGAGNPVVSPDGTRVAFAQLETPADPTLSPHDQVYTMNPDGSNQKRLFFGGFDSDRPEDWKGNTILYRVQTASQFQIWSTDDAGNAQTPLKQNAAEGTLSPRLTQIAYSGLVTGAGFDIFIANADGTGTPLRVTNTTGKFNDFPDWGN